MVRVHQHFVKLQWLAFFSRCVFYAAQCVTCHACRSFSRKRTRAFYFGGICKPAITIDVYLQPV